MQIIQYSKLSLLSSTLNRSLDLKVLVQDYWPTIWWNRNSILVDTRIITVVRHKYCSLAYSKGEAAG
jgi:hypothetical protein